MRVVFATNVLPDEQANGGEICSLEFINALREQGLDVRIVGYERVGRGPMPNDSAAYSAGPWKIEMADAGVRKYIWLLRAILTRCPFTHIKFISRSYLEALRQAGLAEADVLIIDHAHMGWLAECPNLPAKRIYVAHNVEAALYDRIGAGAKGLKRWIYKREGRVLEACERALVSDSDMTWCLSDTDRDALAALGDKSATLQFFDLPGQEFETPQAPIMPTHDIGLIGSWQWEINRQGVQWFLSDVLPLLEGDLSIQIAGSGSQTLTCRDPRVTLLGRVPDAGVFMRENRVLAVPTLVGSGVQLKTIEGLSIGVPLVATTLAARGIASAADYLRVADTAAAFAAALTQALASPRPNPATGAAWAQARRERFRQAVKNAFLPLLSKGPTR